MKFNNSYANLPPLFFTKTTPAKVKDPKVILLNYSLAEELVIDSAYLKEDSAANIFSGNKLSEDSEPIAMAYAGHQFGHFVPELGDGRATLLGELTDQNGVQKDIQLKGSGLTRYSRGGDGRSSLGPVIREYLVSEAMNKLQIPTTRALAAVSTGETVYREIDLPGAVLTRVALSHVRIGTFEYFSHRQDLSAVKQLADYCIDRLYPTLKNTDAPYLGFLESVMDRQIRLITKWLSVGFIHGVMNTDNCSISGETIDFGPCAFMEKFNPNQVFSAIDQQGRYAYSNQAKILLWNLMRFAETLLLLIDKNQDKAVEKAQLVFERYWDTFTEEWSKVMLKKMGITSVKKGDDSLVHEFLDGMTSTQSDFTLSFRYLSHQLSNTPFTESIKPPLFTSDFFKNWEPKWKARLALEKGNQKNKIELMNSVNPIVIPRNHLIEKAIQEAQTSGDYSFMKQLNKCFETPFEYTQDSLEFISPATDENEVTRTFCGT
ncbi:YdiU family protein [Candidatus Marinamargulisbacteria bacterium SCGC AAA071-K20]|nr:YdiU family protein [Candidatus Marinamargulisbacteria bacterium SCGC AAA071-K20]